MGINILQHTLVPKHEILSPQERADLLKRLTAEKDELPKIKLSDPVCKHMKAKRGDVIKITRPSPTAGTAPYYRVVV